MHRLFNLFDVPVALLQPGGIHRSAGQFAGLVEAIVDHQPFVKFFATGRPLSEHALAGAKMGRDVVPDCLRRSDGTGSGAGAFAPAAMGRPDSRHRRDPIGRGMLLGNRRAGPPTEKATASHRSFPSSGRPMGGVAQGYVAFRNGRTIVVDMISK